jgi:hypothetical protein
MAQKLKKAIADVTINFKDGTCERMDYYAMVGSTEDTWYKIMLSPPGISDRVKMNNLLAELSSGLVIAVEKERAAD